MELIGALYRLRWQIELAIKRLKSILHIDRLPAKHPDLARTWLHAHLLLALLLDDITARIGGRHFPLSHRARDKSRTGAGPSSSPPQCLPPFGRRLISK